jgi:hypothetical protein
MIRGLPGHFQYFHPFQSPLNRRKRPITPANAAAETPTRSTSIIQTRRHLLIINPDRIATPFAKRLQRRIVHPLHDRPSKLRCN